MPELNLRPATPDDVELIVTFIRELAVYEKLDHVCIADEEKVRHTLFGPRAFAEVLIAEWAGEPVGYALFLHNYSTFLARPGLYLEDLYVKPEHRGKGIGKALLTRLAKVAVERGCGRMEWVVLDWNKPSIDFYESLGAVPMSEWLIYRLEKDALDAVAQQHSEAAGV